MNTQLRRIAARRQQLIEQGEHQRQTISLAASPWRNTLGRVDQGLSAVRYLTHHPAWLLGGGSAALLVIGPRRIWHWLGRGWIAWQMVARFREF